MRIALGGIVIAITLACSNAQTAPAQQAAAQSSTPEMADAVVAEIGGRKITMKELDDRWQSMDPGERSRITQLLYQNRRNVLDQMMGDLLIEQAAKTAGVPVPKFTEDETAKRLKPVTEADVRQFYEENKDRAQGRSLEQLSDQIRSFLTSNRQQQARAILVDDLKKKANATRILLEPPRVAVEISDDDPSVGPATAPVTIVEFSDYQ
jgi:SurA N-terminal domain